MCSAVKLISLRHSKNEFLVENSDNHWLYRAQHRGTDNTDFSRENRLVWVLTYNDFRENPYCRAGYTARDVPEPARISKLRYDPFDVV